ncbi:MAG TPA: thioredoxin [Candidatus Aenigmarchaeota archaeon]|nr:MAG: thioredoxin [Candidatus Aenigmarchaeota archaeon]HDD46349.1 thioredoxin [Candidatus Aenigmarchaeota archaeon]
MDELERIKREKMEKFMKKAIYPDKPVLLSDRDFKENVKKYDVVVVDMYAEWCMPCKVIAPIIEELAKKYHGKVAFFKMDIDKNPLTAMEFGVMSIPTLLIFKDGKMVDRLVGALPINLIEERIKKFI